MKFRVRISGDFAAAGRVARGARVDKRLVAPGYIAVRTGFAAWQAPWWCFTGLDGEAQVALWRACRPRRRP